MSNLSVLSDEELFDLVKNDDRKAFEMLYDRYKRSLFVYATKKIDSIDAEDILHDLFIKLWDQKDSIHITGKFSFYIFRSLRNKILDYIYHSVHVRRYMDSLEDFSLNSYSHLADYKLREELFMQRVEALLIKYSPKAQQIFKLRIQGYKNSEVAEIVGLSEKTVRNQYSLILSHLKQKLYSIIVLFIIN